MVRHEPPLVWAEYDCTASSPITIPSGEPLWRGTARKVQVAVWPHGEQYLNIEPEGTRGQAPHIIVKSIPWPGQVFEYAKPTDLVIRQQFRYPLLVSWKVMLIVDGQYAVKPDPYNSVQWVPLVRNGVVSRAGNETIMASFYPRTSGYWRIRVAQSNANQLTFYLRTECESSPANPYYVNAVQGPGLTRWEGQLGIGSVSNITEPWVVAGCRYTVGVTSAAGGETVDIDWTVTPNFR